MGFVVEVECRAAKFASADPSPKGLLVGGLCHPFWIEKADIDRTILARESARGASEKLIDGRMATAIHAQSPQC